MRKRAFRAQIPHVLKIQPDGTTSIIAGNGPDGYGGDGAPARGAGLNLPKGIAVDVAGNIYLADYGNSRVRKIDTQGNINTIGGNGKALFSGDGGQATKAGMNPTDVAVDNQGNVFVADQVNHRIRKIAPSGIVTTVAGNGIPGLPRRRRRSDGRGVDRAERHRGGPSRKLVYRR